MVAMLRRQFVDVDDFSIAEISVPLRYKFQETSRHVPADKLIHLKPGPCNPKLITPLIPKSSSPAPSS